MKTILDNFERWLIAGNGAAIARQMHSLECAVGKSISVFELQQIKLAFRILVMTIENEKLLKGE